MVEDTVAEEVRFVLSFLIVELALTRSFVCSLSQAAVEDVVEEEEDTEEEEEGGKRRRFSQNRLTTSYPSLLSED